MQVKIETIPDIVLIELEDSNGNKFNEDFEILEEFSEGPGYFVFGHNKNSGIAIDGSGIERKIIARPDVVPRKYKNSFLKQKRGFKTARQAAAVAIYIRKNLETI